MAKRKCEQPLIALLPACKRPLRELSVYSRPCTPHTLQGAPKRKRRPEPSPQRESPPLPPHTEDTAAQSHPPSKKPKLSPGTTASPDYQCQKDEEFNEYNTFHFWRTPLPDIDLSELDGACDSDKQATSTGTDVLEEMDS
ncbi:hypothetical protein GDO81_001634 [Engystomops pustulosus]|uniref:Putative WW-binding domain-containing protein n=1 Tax=Engystomops pustulosus TaxID=76066 RepID=A0AAV7DF33_ENGPU|nr:hypothetical protein GDO81_001634 [Engystomops pustulosus]KAG8595789.1 hypothetical protein GDO81_001634 [Engystomops pustulosus]